MIERLQGTVESVTFIKNISQGLDLCEIQIDFDKLKVFYNSSDLIEYLHKEVLYTIRPDVIDGAMEMVVCELVALSTVQTVQSTENIKLIPEGNKRTVCNFSSRSIRYGSFYPNCVAFFSKYEFGSSAKAEWADCTLIDTDSKEFQVKLFATGQNKDELARTLNAYIGGYVAFDLQSTRYGNQTKEFFGLPNNVELSPEVEVAKSVVLQLMQEDSALAEYNSKYQFIDNLLEVIDGEPGYALVRIASEIYMINAIDNISVELDIKAMKRAAICSRGYLLPKKRAWSRPVLNINKLNMVPTLKTDSELMNILDIMSEEEPTSTKLTYIKIRKLVDDIIKIRRGISDEKETADFNDAVSLFNGLL